MKPARALSFDLDGTLYRVQRLRVAWRLRWERGLLVAMIAAREKIRHEAPLPDGKALLDREAELVAPSFGMSVAEARERIAALRTALPEALTRGVSPYAGVESALEAASVRGLKLAVLSDYEPGSKLRWLGLDHLPWAAVVGADQLGALKPHRRPFHTLAEQLGVPPETIVHVGDREDLDVEGALAAGMRAWRFAPRGAGPTRAEEVFSQWAMGLFMRLVG